MDSTESLLRCSPCPEPRWTQDSEVERLRARVAELERELADRTERANAASPPPQDRIYWLDRWRHRPEPDARRRGAAALRAALASSDARRVAGRDPRRLAR